MSHHLCSWNGWDLFNFSVSVLLIGFWIGKWVWEE